MELLNVTRTPLSKGIEQYMFTLPYCLRLSSIKIKEWLQRNMICQEHWNFKAQFFGTFNIRNFSMSAIQKVFNVSREELMLVTNKRAIGKINKLGKC